MNYESKTRHHDWTEPCTLIGGYICELTYPERNEWGVYCRKRLELLEYHVAVYAVEALANMNTLRQRVEAQSALFNIAEQWYAELEKRRAEQAEADEKAKNAKVAE